MYKYILEDSQIDQNHQQKYSKIAWNIQPISICMHLAEKQKNWLHTLIAYPASPTSSVAAPIPWPGNANE